MPAVGMREVALPAMAAGRAVGAFNVILLEHAEAIVAGAEAAGAPVVLAVSENCVRYHGGLGALGAACVWMARGASVPVALHLDPAPSPGLVADAASAGFELDTRRSRSATRRTRLRRSSRGPARRSA